MEYEILIVVVFLVIGVIYLRGPRVLMWFIYRTKLIQRLPEIDRKLHEGKYGPGEVIRAEYVIWFFTIIKLYSSDYDEEVA